MYPSRITLWLAVNYSPDFGGATSVDQVWRRTIHTAFLPQPGDDVVLWPEEDDDAGHGVTWPVRNRTWAHDGQVDVELVAIRVDPSERAVADMLAVPNRERPWYTDADGNDLNERLLDGRWELVSGTPLSSPMPRLTGP